MISVVFGLTLGVAACGGGGGTQTTTGAITFWQDVAPIYNSKCFGEAGDVVGTISET